MGRCNGLFRHTPLWNNPLVPDNIIDGIAATWKEKGVKVLGDLCDKDTFADLTFIKELYQLPGSHFLKKL